MNHSKKWAVLLLLFVAVVIQGERTTRPDEESEALLKYKDLIDTSVDKALEYLATQQAENGSFPGQYGQTTAMAALAGMAFLSKGYTPGLGPFGENINRSIDFVLSNEQVRDGKPSGYLLHSAQGKMYAHCISTLFLSEVSGMVAAGPVVLGIRRDRDRRVGLFGERGQVQQADIVLLRELVGLHPATVGGEQPMVRRAPDLVPRVELEP
mgnify:CR=1 FL=1